MRSDSFMPLCKFAAFLLAATAGGMQAVSAEGPGIQHFNVRIFGKSSGESVKLLLPKGTGEIAPETVMVDVGDDDRFYAATVRYPKSLSLNATRTALNRRHQKWERKSFAKDPTMGLWRNDDEKLSIQLSEDEDNIVVIYIKYDMLPRRAERIVEDALRDALKDATPEELGRLPEVLRDSE